MIKDNYDKVDDFNSIYEQHELLISLLVDIYFIEVLKEEKKDNID